MEEIKFYTVGEASHLIGVSRVTIHNWIKTGDINPIHIVGTNHYISYAIPAEEVKKKIEEEKSIVMGAIKGTFKQYGAVLEKLADE